MSREKAQKGHIAGSRNTKKENMTNFVIPKVLPVEIIDVDDDGNLLCWPTKLPKSLIKNLAHHDNNETAGNDPIPVLGLEAEQAARFSPAPGIRDRFLVKAHRVDDLHYTVTIIRKIGRERERILALYKEQNGAGFAQPVDRAEKHGFFIKKADRANAKNGDLVWIEKEKRDFARRRSSSKQQNAIIIDVAGNIEAPGAYSLIALASHDIPIDFPSDVVDEALNVTLPSMEGRVDLRDIGLLTIDPADAKDHDDAVSAIPDETQDQDGNLVNAGGFRVWVAIADVSWFVRPGSGLDREALERGNSVYLPDRVVPMLPEELSNNLCSLRDREDRPCLAVEMILNKDGQMIGYKFVRAMMRSAAKLSYEAAQDIIMGAQGPDKTVTQTVNHLYAAYQCRLKEREKRAPLDLELVERKIILGKDGLVDQVIQRERFDAHKLIEEFMILANVAAAETLEKEKTALIYRVHDAPDSEKLQAVRNYLKTLDYTLIKGNSIRPNHFNQILKIAEKRDQKEIVSEVVLRTQRQAVYDTQNLGHFGLNLNRYAHFTSPIRRYADLTVHRALIKACKLGDGGQTNIEAERLTEISENISTLERRAMMAERQTNDRYLSDYLSDQVGVKFDARIRGVTRFGMFVMLDITGADGFIPMRSLSGRGWQFDEAMSRVVDRHNGDYYFLGQNVIVRLKEAMPIEGGLVFEINTKPIHDPDSKKSKTKHYKLSQTSDKTDRSKGGKAKISKTHQAKLKKRKKSRKRKGK